ncbi:unnamed protein product [Ilex paraguariensis]|uniref:D-aminoacid aminotransferase-like PLP-dependent enzymes superfamily protein n=1 Tax=Ilex paraguariensis TaxID=185542 RepID=A0ABC8R414_9AQUA
MSGTRFLIVNGVLSPSSDTPPVSTVLEAQPGAYTTSRTHNAGLHLLFWERHLRRLAESARILFSSNPNLLFKPEKSKKIPFSSLNAQSSLWDPMIRSLVENSMREVIPIALKERKSGEELAITTLVSGNLDKLSESEGLDEERLSRVFDLYVHVGVYVPTVFGITENAMHLAVVGRGRDVANAKYADWVRLRKALEKLRPPWASELLLSNDGDRILEGCLTNFFVVCRKDKDEGNYGAEGSDLHDHRSAYSIEIQTAPINDGVLPGIIRQVIIEVCSRNGVPFREVTPLWSKREMWEEAFTTNSLRLLQHVETICAPRSWELLEQKSWKGLTWEEKRFKEGPGRITALIQQGILEKASLEVYPTTLFTC